MLDIVKPTIILDKEKCVANIENMATKATVSKVKFRPHFKSHQSAFIGNWFRRAGIHAITVTSVSMANYFAEYGWKDITIAMPVNILESHEINELARNIDLNIIAETLSPLQHLESMLVYEIGMYIEIDTGYHRSGINWNNHKEIDEILFFCSTATKIKFKGFITHSGHTYQADSPDEILNIYKDTVRKLTYLKERYIQKWPMLELSIGDTPSCSLIDDFSEVDEIRPGNFIFYDLQQFSLMSCSFEDISMVIACPVIAKDSERLELIIYGGAAHLSKEFLYKQNGERIYGYIVQFKDKKWDLPLTGAFLSSISQEHGIVKVSQEIFDSFERGDILGIIPVHSCLTANLMRKYQTLQGGKVDY